MHLVNPHVFVVGETKLENDNLRDYLEWVGAPEWVSDAPTDGEKLIEVEGRMCYRSFKPGLNANVKKIREHNDQYLNNILEVKHGSVLEHTFINFIFADVSRVFTHELVRHRVGVAISQESLRFVRLTELGLWVPTVIRENKDAMTFMCSCFEIMEEWQKEFAHILGVDKMKDFHQKKEATSGMRRIAPIGLSTSIGWTANIRTIRHCIEMRTAPGAEEEIRLVFGRVGTLMKDRYPNLFGDYTVEVVAGHPWFKTKNQKV